MVKSKITAMIGVCGGVIIIKIKSHYYFSSPEETAATANTTLSQEHKEPRPFRSD